MTAAAGGSAAAVRIRQAEIGDACDVAALLEVLGYPCTRDEAAERIVLVQSDPRMQLLLAERGSAVCGLVALDIRYSLARGSDLARVTALVVAPQCAGQGIGRRLLQEVERIARRERLARIEITSNPGRTDAHAFYQRCGYSDGSRHFIKLLGD